MTTEKTWALIANGERAKIVTNLGDHQAQQVQVVGSRQLELDRQSTKNSNRRPALIGKSRFGTEPHTDPVRNRERLFIEKISEYFADKYHQGEFDALLVVAAPRTLGDVIKAFPDSLRGVIVAQSDIDLIHLDDMDLIQALLAILKGRRVKG
jgi:protein required for attachment to host cells